ncbi:cytokinesis protein sepa (fh1 2 protein) [Lentinula edodes]|uniref:Cytokinesis protein sepa (Fh1 2 protein) n=1 Tax=Lentinula edodes TaxID=5353 RepID=A0A1Q3E3Y3_LENED|nr:cytokinesis protein sepa (fh1 2 protein) [Lentinula edodes]
MTNPTLTSDGVELNKYMIQRSRAERDKAYDLYPNHRPASPSTTVSWSDSSTAYSDSFQSKPPRDPQTARARRSEASSTSSADVDNDNPLRGPSAIEICPFPRCLRYEFELPRPTDDEIEALFEQVKLTRGVDDLNLPVEQKWNLVKSDLHIRWKEEKTRDEQAKRQIETGQSSAIIVDTPEWYVRKFLDKTITPKQASSLQVSLRSKEVSWFHHFIEIQGTSVLAQTLNHISRKGSSRREHDIQLEYEVAKCLKHIFNNHSATDKALAHPQIVTQVASSLNSPHIPTRKLLLDLLSFLTYWNEGKIQPVVVSALEVLSSSNNENGGVYDFWFKSFEQTLSGRGKMGSLVGASEDVKKAGGIDTNLNDYALSNLILIVGILDFIEDLDLRLHHRSRMESAGLHHIIALCQEFNVPNIDKKLRQLQGSFDEDERNLRSQLDQEILKDLNNPGDVYKAIFAKIESSKARDYFLSMMQHLLLIREEGEPMVHYYQLIDSMVTDIVMDKKLAGAEQRFGHSVERIIAQFNETGRLQEVEDELQKSRSEALRLKLENDALLDEISKGQEGMVGRLKEEMLRLEQKLATSRETTARLQNQVESERAEYEDQINQLETQIIELFRMLKEVGRGVTTVLDTGGMDRKTLVQTLEKQFQRTQTINKLEGKDVFGRRRKKEGGFEESDDDDREDTPGKSSLRRSRVLTSKKSLSKKGDKAEDSNRASQFMDAEDAHAEEQIQQQLNAGASFNSPSSISRSIRGSPRPGGSKTSDKLAGRYDHLEDFVSGGDSSLQYVRGEDSTDDDSSKRLTHPTNDNVPTSVSSDGSHDTGITPGQGSLADQLSFPGSAPSSSSSSLASSPAPPPPPMPGSARSNTSFGSNPNSARASMLLGANPLSARKDLPITPNIKMKQLQWDKLPQQQVAKTVWNEDQPSRENEMIKILKDDGVWMEMEEDFKAKQLVINLMARQKRAELKSVLDVETKKRVEILIQGVKKLEPEEIARKIQQFDQDLCTQVFLSELKRVLPSPEQVGKLNVYRNADPKELAELHPADRLMVKLIQIDRLGPRIEGMLYKCAFDERWSLLDDGAQKLTEAGNALLNAKSFKELLSLILLVGNYMNGSGIKGGAFGFRVSSVNKLVDTKSVNNTTLLHFLERTVVKHFPAMEEFLEELEKPAEAYRVNLQEVRKGHIDLRDGLKQIRKELGDHFADMNRNDQFGIRMWSFVKKANAQVEDLGDDVNSASAVFTEVVKYYGEEDRNMTSSEFYAIFKTFVTSYRKCKADNQSFAEARLAVEKRKQVAQEMRENREKAAAANNESDDVLDSLLEKLRNGEGGRKSRRTRGTAEAQPAIPLTLQLDSSAVNDTADIARDMLAQLQSNGFAPMPSPTATSNPSTRRRTRRRMEAPTSDSLLDLRTPTSPLAVEVELDLGSETDS